MGTVWKHHQKWPRKDTIRSSMILWIVLFLMNYAMQKKH